MPDLPFKSIWWALVVLLLSTGHCSIDAGMYLLYIWILRSFVMLAILWTCTLHFSSGAGTHENYLANGYTTILDANDTLNRSLVAGKGKTLNYVPGEGKTALSRRKRDLLFPSGVKLCSHETVQQAVQNHLNYFHLRGKNQTFNLYLFLKDSGIVAKNGNCKGALQMTSIV